MLIAVMSDSHDNIWNLEKAVDIIKEREADMVIHCGDFVAPFTLKYLESAGVPVHGVFGNNDGDQHLLTKISLIECSNITLHGLFGAVDMGAWKVAFTHQRETAWGLIKSGLYDLACYGHTHVHHVEKVGGKLLLNPGEVMGKDGDPGFCLVDTETGAVERMGL